jgi:hypothetical protein
MTRLNNLNHRQELFKACKWLLEYNTGKKITIKLLRETYKKWSESQFPKSMCFGEFVQKLFSDDI